MGSAIRVGETRIEVDEYLEAPARLEEALGRVRQMGGHAECECVQPARKLVVRRLGARHILAVWPDDGPSHAFACPFYREEHDGLASSMAEGLAADQPPPLLVDFPLERRSALPRKPPAEPSTSAGDVTAQRGDDAKRLSLAALLELVWLRSRLNCWAAGWKRDWWRVRRELYRVAQDTHVGGRRLDELLYVPLPFRRDAERKDAVDREWQQLMTDLEPRDGVVPRRLILTEVKALSKAAFGYKLELRNLPWPVYLQREQWEHLQARYARALMGVSHKSEPPLKLVGLLLVEAAANGKHYFSLCDAALLMTSEHWIPCHTTAELRLADHLVDQARAFTRPMGADEAAPAIPDFWMHDAGEPRPTALEVLGVDAVPYRERKLRRVSALREAGHPVWIWDTTRGEIPSLPPRA